MKKNLSRSQQEAANKKYQEREGRLRSNPTSDEVIKGDALNALLVDLSDPSISTSSWRVAQVPLPADLAIPSLVFRFAPKPDAKNSQALGRGVIALARLDTIKGNPWGTVMSMDALDERAEGLRGRIYQGPGPVPRWKTIAGCPDRADQFHCLAEGQGQ